MGNGNSNGPSGSLICPRCGKDNFAFAAFCHRCGEPFDEADNTLALSDDPGASPEKNHVLKATPTERAFTSTVRKLWRWESVLGFVLLALTLGYALFTWR